MNLSLQTLGQFLARSGLHFLVYKVAAFALGLRSLPFQTLSPPWFSCAQTSLKREGRKAPPPTPLARTLARRSGQQALSSLWLLAEQQAAEPRYQTPVR